MSNKHRPRGEITNPSHIGTCPDCGKARWRTRRQAVQAAQRIYPGQHMSPYQCGDFWHLGHLPRIVRSGDLARDDLVSTRQPPRP